MPYSQIVQGGQGQGSVGEADEYLTDLMDSDTMLTLENTDDAIKRVGNYLSRQDIEGDKRTVFLQRF